MSRDIAEGPAGLEQALAKVLSQSKADPEFAKQKHFITYQIGDQKSLILVDLPNILYGDCDNRPAPSVVREVIARFGKLQDWTQQENAKEAEAFRSGQVNTYVPPTGGRRSLAELEDKLREASRKFGVKRPEIATPVKSPSVEPLRGFAKFGGLFAGRVDNDKQQPRSRVTPKKP